MHDSLTTMFKTRVIILFLAIVADKMAFSLTTTHCDADTMRHINVQIMTTESTERQNQLRMKPFVFLPSVPRPAREECRKTHVQGSPQSRASLNTLVKSHFDSWRQRTEPPYARWEPFDGRTSPVLLKNRRYAP